MTFFFFPFQVYYYRFPFACSMAMWTFNAYQGSRCNIEYSTDSCIANVVLDLFAGHQIYPEVGLSLEVDNQAKEYEQILELAVVDLPTQPEPYYKVL
jgi:hypothetical protein